MVTAADIRYTLVHEHGYSEEAANNIKKRANLLATLETEMDKNKKLPDLNNVEDNPPEIDVDESLIERSDPKWHDYVMSLFTKEEIIKGNPITDGLRRVADLLFNISSITTQVLQCPTLENGKRAVVKVQVCVRDSEIYEGASDVCSDNTEHPFCQHPISTAETKAEGRALRKALRLRKIVAAEEMGDVDLINSQEKISSTQINFIDLMCQKDRLDINVIEFLKLNGHSNTKDLTHQQSLDLQEKLSEYQRDVKLIPEEIKTYQSNWREK